VSPPNRHPRESGDLAQFAGTGLSEIPAFAGMTTRGDGDAVGAT
jgi:hypothetical protein